VLKGRLFLEVDIKSSEEKILTDIPVQDVKNSFEQWPKCCKHV
jgi:hypothetical protein